MISVDSTNRLQPGPDPALRPALPAQEITDKLSGLVAGQRLLAQIQSLMPNGSYRALINQRSVTLALPFAVKAGDSIELEVTESDGKLTLAVVAPESAGAEKAGNESAATSLSRTGQLISNLLGGSRDAKGGPVALPLNANQPIAATPPTSAQALQPLLEQAITQSGMFYESHQAEWVEGRYSKEQLLQEPQGKLAPQVSAPQVSAPQVPAPPGLPVSGEAHGMASAIAAGDQAEWIEGRYSTSAIPDGDRAERADGRYGKDQLHVEPEGKLASRMPAQQGSPVAGEARSMASAIPDAAPMPMKAAEAGATTSQPGPVAQPVAPQAQAIVQQQLEAFATQNFSWQGQVWPGQQMEWQIDEPNERRDNGGGESIEGSDKWQTRLRLTLPTLGELDARLHIQGKQITLAVTATDSDTRALLRGGAASLRTQLEQAGLDLASLGVSAPQESPQS